MGRRQGPTGPKIALWLLVAILLVMGLGMLTACSGGSQGATEPRPEPEPCNCPAPEPAEIVIPHGTGEWLGMATSGPSDSGFHMLGQGAIIRENEWRRANGLPEVELPGGK